MVVGCEGEVNLINNNLKFTFMKTNYIKILFIFLILSASYACKDNVTDFNEIYIPNETAESDFFSVEFKYSDTIRLLINKQGYVDIVVSSDKKDVLQTHLSEYEYYVATDDSLSESGHQMNTQKSSFPFSFTNCEISETPKISVEIIEMNENSNEIDLRCRKIKSQTLSSIQKIIVNPYPWYYEYTSKVHDYYGKVKHTNRTSNGEYIPPTLARYGFKKCLLCKVITWPNGQWRVLSEGYGYNYDNNAFGYDGSHYNGDNIYRLYTGVRSYSPDNFWIKFSKDSIPEW